jgi:hypothetical protein
MERFRFHRFAALALVLAWPALGQATGAYGAEPPEVHLHAPFARVDTPIRRVDQRYWFYDLSSTVSLPDSYQPQSADGVRLSVINGVVHDHPVSQAQYGLQLAGSYFLDPKPAYVDRLVAYAEHLTGEALVSRGAWYFPYQFPFDLHGFGVDVMQPPWYSAMAQGQILSLFVATYRITGKRKYLEAARWTFNSFKNGHQGLKEREPWVTSIDPGGYLWLEEYAQDPATQDYTFNGHMFAAVGLHDYWQVTQDEEAAHLLQGAIATIKHFLPTMRQPGHTCRYCVRHPSVRSPHYHRVHTEQFVALYTMTGDTDLAQAADAFTYDSPDERYGGTVMLSAGGHSRFHFAANGRAYDSTGDHLPQPTEMIASHRATIAGRAGTWLEIGDGPWSGYWMQELPPKVYLKGVFQPLTFYPPRTVSLAPGKYDFRGIDSLGHVTYASRTIGAPVQTTFDQHAVLDSVHCVRLASGPDAGRWVALGPLVTVDVPAQLASSSDDEHR